MPCLEKPDGIPRGKIQELTGESADGSTGVAARLLAQPARAAAQTMARINRDAVAALGDMQRYSISIRKERAPCRVADFASIRLQTLGREPVDHLVSGHRSKHILRMRHREIKHMLAATGVILSPR